MKNIDFNFYTNLIKRYAKKSNDYNWTNGNGFLGANGSRKKIKPEGLDKNIAKENLLLMKNIFEKNNLFFYLIGGTLLGAIRDKDFIDYDNDTDIRIYYRDIPLMVKCVPELIKVGLEPLRISEGEISFVRNNEYIDIEFLREHEESRFTEKFDKITFCESEFNIPQYVDEYLTICYGDWRVKSKNHTWISPK